MLCKVLLLRLRLPPCTGCVVVSVWAAGDMDAGFNAVGGLSDSRTCDEGAAAGGCIVGCIFNIHCICRVGRHVCHLNFLCIVIGVVIGIGVVVVVAIVIVIVLRNLGPLCCGTTLCVGSCKILCAGSFVDIPSQNDESGQRQHPENQYADPVTTRCSD